MFVIRGKHPDNPHWEDIDECETEEEAERLLFEYEMAFRGSGITLRIRRR